MNAIYVAALLVAIAVIAIVMTIYSGSTGTTGVARSLSIIDGQVDRASVLAHELSPRERLIQPFFDRMQAIARRVSPSGTADRLGRLLDRAGNPALWTAERIMGLKGASLLVGVLIGLTVGGISLKGLLLSALFGAALFYLPDLLLYNAGLHRQDAASKGLADALDMLTVCVEAGQGFDASLLQVARNTEGPISGEFARVLSEIQIGKTRAEAFTALGDRLKLPVVKNFVSALVQADRLGLPIAAVLREQTAAMRISRRQMAEEKAQKVAVKILFPVMFCILPALFVVILGPGVIRMMQFFGNL